MNQQVKLVVAQTLDGQEEQFYILNNVVLGEGGFGVVKKATSKDTTREYAVKILPYKGEEKKIKIQKQINILRILPENRHLVRVMPFKFYSENNYYIFMELCKEGTLTDYFREPHYLSEEKILDIFWQLFSGYRVLWENKIVHQDLKLANVLVKDGVLKIADFGFSILSENYIPTNKREGTLTYMPVEPFTDPNYTPNEKTDIYALGIMLFELITKRHPYINEKGIGNYKVYLTLLSKAELVIPEVVSTFSAPIQGLFDLVVRMVAKNAKNRATCQQIYDYIDNDEIFSKLREKYADQTKEIVLDPLKVTVVDRTDVIVVPFPVKPEDEKKYVENIKNIVQVKKNEENRKIIVKVEKWILSLRLAVYFLDRLARRLFVEKLRGEFSSQKVHCYNKVILGCFLVEGKITNWILQELRHPSEFTKDEISIFKGSEEGGFIIGIIRRDKEYIQYEITDNLKRTNQINSKQHKSRIDMAQKDQFNSLINSVIPDFKECIAHKANLIHDRRDLITISYLADGINILKPLPIASQQLSLQNYFYSTETKSQHELYSNIEGYLKENKIESNISEEIYSEEESNLALN